MSKCISSLTQLFITKEFDERASYYESQEIRDFLLGEPQEIKDFLSTES